MLFPGLPESVFVAPLVSMPPQLKRTPLEWTMFPCVMKYEAGNPESGHKDPSGNITSRLLVPLLATTETIGSKNQLQLQSTVVLHAKSGNYSLSNRGMQAKLTKVVRCSLTSALLSAKQLASPQLQIPITLSKVNAKHSGSA